MRNIFQFDADITFLALCLWREARGEVLPLARIAVAWVVMTRVKLGGWWGADVMSVLFHPEQFSSLTAEKDPQLATWPRSGDLVWEECLTIAEQVYFGGTANPVIGATHYYDVSIPAPAWAETGQFLKQIGRLRFYHAA